MNPYLKAKVFSNEFELNFFTDFLEEENIVYYIRKYHDTAYNGIYTGQMGFAELYVREDYLDKALKLINIIEKEIDK